IPTWIFTEFMTGTNLDNKTKNKFVGGTNGVGVKITSAYSKHLTVETCDGSLKFIQQNRTIKDIDDPIITECDEGEDEYTKLTFMLDYDLVKYNKKNILDLHDLVKTRVLQCATFCKNATVYFNNK